MIVPVKNALKHKRVVRIDGFFCAAILGDWRSPDSSKFIISGIPNSSPSGTVVEFGDKGCTASYVDALSTSPLFAVVEDIGSPLFDAAVDCILAISASRVTMGSRGKGVSRISSAVGSLLPANQVLVGSYCSVVTSSLEFSISASQFGGTLRAHM